MNHTKVNFLKKQIVYFIFLIALSLLIWHYGPMVYIGNSPFLQLPEKRLYLISICFLLWLLKMIAFDIQPHIAEASPAPMTDIEKTKARLKGRFQGALHFLKKTVISKQGKRTSLSKLPWYLLMGPTQAGKTSLLMRSGINFILAKQAKTPHQTLASDLCDWWATRDAVLVDVPGDYISPASEKTTGPLLWHYFLELIKQAHMGPSLQGVVIALNLPELMKDPRLQNKYDLKKIMQDVAVSAHRSLPIHLVVTKCDLLPGFNEFFSEMSSDELGQAWGITLPPLNQNENRIDVFTSRFNNLIKRINNQLIVRLHQERNPLARPFIKDFPLHIERLKEALIQFIKNHLAADLHLHSVHLTSSAQHHLDEPPAYLSNPAQSHALQLMSAPPPPNRSYFIRQLILQQLLIAPVAAAPSTALPTWQRNLAYATAVGVITTSVVLLGRDFQWSVHATQTIQHDLVQYQKGLRASNRGSDDLIHSLPLLNALREAAHPNRHKLLLQFYSNKSQETAETIYNQALQTIVLPKIKQYFESYLRSTANKNPEQVYAILKAYLMLSDKNYFDVDYIATELKPFLPQTANQNDLVQLTAYIYDAINAPQLSVKLNEALITDTRKQLLNLSNTNLGFVLLRNIEHNDVNSLVGLGTHLGNPPVFMSRVVLPEIPAMFTAKEFKKITTSEINTVANEVLNGNWVLGPRAVLADQLAVGSLAAQLHAQYIANYVDIWESLLANLELTTPKDLMQVAEMISIITGSHSPLLQLLDTIKENTAFSPITLASPKLQNLSVVLMDATNNQSSLLYQIFISLKQLDNYLKAIMQSPDRETAIIAATAKRMQDGVAGPIAEIHLIAEQSPEPLKTWLHTIATNTWKHMLFASGQEIEKIWETTVLATYRSQMADRYPFNPTSAYEVNLQQFTQFFGQQGQLASFYQAYLKPFILEDDNDTLHWRVVDNAKLPFSESALQRLEHANRLQRAFFPNGDNKLYVPFALQPLSIDNKMKGLVFNINGQEVPYQKNSTATDRLIVWPGANTQHASSINFISPENTLLTKTAAGEWGWFKLVNHATQGVRSRKELVLNFNVDGHMAKYILLTQGHFNPFLPLNLERFELPPSLG